MLKCRRVRRDIQAHARARASAYKRFGSYVSILPFPDSLLPPVPLLPCYCQSSRARANAIKRFDANLSIVLFCCPAPTGLDAVVRVMRGSAVQYALCVCLARARRVRWEQAQAGAVPQ